MLFAAIHKLSSNSLRNRRSKSNRTKSNRNRGRNQRPRFGRDRQLTAEALEARRVLASYVVNTLDDVVSATDGVISLREAIQAANTNASVNEAIHDGVAAGVTEFITFDAALSAGTITLGGAQLEITDALSIALGDATSLTIDGDDNSRIFAISDGTGTASISGLTITGGVADDAGGILVSTDQQLTLDSVSITGNTANGASGSGGGILNQGTLLVSNSSITANVANRAGGGIESTDGSMTTLTNVNLNMNVAGPTETAAPGNGGGLHVTGDGDVVINGGTVSNNTAASEGGGLWNSSGVMTIDGTTIDANFTQSAGAADDAQGGGGVFNNGGTVIIANATISNNEALDPDAGDTQDDGGGGIFNDGGSVTITDSTIVGNLATDGRGNGGGLLSIGGSVTISGGNISGNQAARAGGGIENNDATITLTDVTVGGQATADGNGAGINGGGLHVSGPGVTNITDGSIANNNAGNEGGGLWNSAVGTMTVDGTTVSANRASIGGGLFNDAGEGTADQSFDLDFVALNGSGVTGNGNLTVSAPTETTREIRVVINASGLQDLTAIPGAIHVAHIHGQFAGNAARPLLEQGDGPFFDGAGGTANGFPPVNSILPSVADDDGLTIDDGFLDFLEGRPDYGPVILNLTSTQLRDVDGGSNPPDGIPPLGHFLNLLTNGDINAAALFPNGTTFTLDTTYTFDLTNADEARQFNNLAPLELREIVLHGQTIDKAISDAIDAAAMGTAPAGVDLGDGTAFRVTAPVAAATIVANSGSLVVNGATISNNTATGDDSTQGGGGIANERGSLTVIDTDITGNTALGTSGSGGGVLNLGGTISIQGGEISGNTANRAGGGIETTAGSNVSLSGVSLDNNNAGIGAGATAAPGNGGGLHVSGDGTVNVTGGTVSGNHAASEGGGLWNGGGVMTVSGTTISSNTASGADPDNGGGGLFNNLGTLNITGATISNNVADGASGSGGGILNFGGVLSIGNANITGNTANRAGGGIESTDGSMTTLTDVTLNMNVAGPTETAAPGNGGGLHVTGDGDVVINGGTVNDNTAASEGGGLWNSSGTMTVTGTTLNANTASGAAADNGGGGLFNNGGTLNLDGATISNNVANGASGSGGGMLNFGGSVTISNTMITANTANRTGGGIETTAGSSVALVDVLLNNNDAGVGSGATAAPGNGGGLHVSGDGMVNVTRGTVSNNNAASEGGGLWNDSGVMTVSGTTLDGNTASGAEADNGGGGLFNNGGTLNVTDASITNNAADGASGSGGGLFNETGGRVTVSNTTISGNTANRAGGGVEDNAGDSLSLNAVQLTGNSAGSTPGNGGGLHITGAGNVSVINSSVVDNQSTSEGGGLWNSAVGTLTVTGSTIAGNSSTDGGGIFNDGDAGDVSLTNSTVSGNLATGIGGGIASEGANVSLTSVTIALNAATNGGGIHIGGGTVAAINTIVGTNSATLGPDLSGTLTSNGNNLVGSTSDATIAGATASDLLDISPGLVAIADNGGMTLTHALMPTSPALNAGVAAGLTTDQRGMDRPLGPGIDIGAFESPLVGTVAPGTPSLSIAAANANRREGDSGTTPFTFTVTRSEETNVATTVQYAVSSSGSANEADFAGGVFPTGTVSFAIGDSSRTITVNVSGDTDIEANESFTVTLSNASGNAIIANASANGTIQDDDRPIIPSRILTPEFVARPYKIDGDGAPTAIIFQANAETTISVSPIGSVSVTEIVRVLNEDLQQVSSYVNGLATAPLEAGELYAIVFEASSSDRFYFVASSAGPGAVDVGAPTNILQATDTTGEGETTARDALVIINALADNDSSNAQNAASYRFLDVNRDGTVSARDALNVINELARRSSSINVPSAAQWVAAEPLSGLAIPSTETAEREAAFAAIGMEPETVMGFGANMDDSWVPSNSRTDHARDVDRFMAAEGNDRDEVDGDEIEGLLTV